MVRGFAPAAALLTCLAVLDGRGGSNATKTTEAHGTSAATAPTFPFPRFEANQLTTLQVADALTAEGFRLRPIVNGQPSSGYRATNLPVGSYVRVGVPASFRYEVKLTPIPMQIEVGNVLIEVRGSPNVLRRLEAVVSTLQLCKKLVRLTGLCPGAPAREHR